MAGPRYLLDTNVLSAVVKRPRRELARRIAAMNRGEYCTSIVVAWELRYGVRKKGSPAGGTAWLTGRQLDELLLSSFILTNGLLWTTLTLVLSDDALRRF